VNDPGVIAGVVDCTLSTAILQELSDVLQRPKLCFSAEMCLIIVEELHAVCDINSPAEAIHVITTDPDDDRILECALEAGARSTQRSGCELEGRPAQKKRPGEAEAFPK
jgi:predicted nucleic acid-binding protein